MGCGRRIGVAPPLRMGETAFAEVENVFAQPGGMFMPEAEDFDEASAPLGGGWDFDSFKLEMLDKATETSAASSSGLNGAIGFTSCENVDFHEDAVPQEGVAALRPPSEEDTVPEEGIAALRAFDQEVSREPLQLFHESTCGSSATASTSLTRCGSFRDRESTGLSSEQTGLSITEDTVPLSPSSSPSFSLTAVSL